MERRKEFIDILRKIDFCRFLKDVLNFSVNGFIIAVCFCLACERGWLPYIEDEITDGIYNSVRCCIKLLIMFVLFIRGICGCYFKEKKENICTIVIREDEGEDKDEQ